ncbi:eIF2A-related protein [Candidatus Oscillochloris fontis]|uniref:nSTAND1 domain-containing NTPase n=1 Tax=Candidatus Oscillochloris fontis TaxID=2496868 RepID=UPI00101E0049|nr:peptidase C14 [Candidatus Oscillochloris fontis]
MSAKPSTTEPFTSLTALRTAHVDLLKRHRANGETPELLTAVGEFLERSRSTGAILAEDEERWTAQSLIDYWTTSLYRAGNPTPNYVLVEFDPDQAPALPDSVCPYMGLDAFEKDHAPLFFGRHRVIADLVEKLREQRLVAIVGPSGSGKSSLVRAGLLPKLLEDAIPGSANWQILPPMVPGSDPKAALDRTLALSVDADTPLLLVIDQFEEIFTLCTNEDDRQIFLNHLLTLSTQTTPPHRVVLTMRSDFENSITRAATLEALYQDGKVVLPPMTASDLREAIERPAEQVGLKFEAGLVDALLGDILGEPAALPLLQYSLLKLWEARERNRVTLNAYKHVGGGRLALARGADAVYNSLIPEDQVAAKRILLRLVRLGEGLEVTSNRIQRTDLDRGGEDPGRIERVVQKLVAARLLRLSAGENPEDTQIEIAHEALVRNWATFIEWLEDERHDLRQRQRLRSAAEQWHHMGQDASALLSGRLLEQAQHYTDLNPQECAFVDAGVAAEEAKVRREARTNRLIRILLVVTSIASVIAIMFAVQVNLARADVEQQRKIVDIQRLAFAAQIQSRENPEVGVLLAYEANVGNDNPITNQALREAISAISWQPTPLLGHTNWVNSAVFSPDGSRILTTSWDNTARLWDHSGQLLVTFSGHTEGVNYAVFSPDGKHILTASVDGTARLWDVSGQHLVTLSGHTDSVTHAIFSPDGTRILTASLDTTARLWDLNGELLATLSEHTELVSSIAFSPDGTRILTASWDDTARLWDTNGQHLATLSGHRIGVMSAVFSPDGTRILTASWDGTARLWDTNGQHLVTLSGHTNPLSSAVFSPDGTRILTASEDGTARLWDTDGQLITILSGHTDSVTSTTFSPDGRHILTASRDTTARLWNETDQPLATLTGHTGAVNDAIYSPDGQSIFTVSNDTTARLWDAHGIPLVLLKHEGAVYKPIFNADGTRILTASFDKTARLWDTNGQLLATLSGHTDIVKQAVFSPDETRILTASEDGTARLWDIDGQLLITLAEHTATVTSAVFSPDGTRILTASRDQTARLWDANGQTIATLADHTDDVTSAVFSPNGSRILTASFDNTARLWDANGKLIAILADHTGWVTSAIFSPDGTHILTASDDNTARLWDSNGELITILSGHTSDVTSAVFSPDGTHILTASRDLTARLWDANGQPLTTFTGHTGPIWSAVFSPDGSRILTASADGTARQYLVTSEDLRRAAACRVGRGLTEEEIVLFQVPTPLAFDFAQRECPPVYSWQR